MLTLSPAPCFPVAGSTSVLLSCGLESVCLMCLASAPAHHPGSGQMHMQQWPPRTARPPACPAGSSVCVSIALFFLA